MEHTSAVNRLVLASLVAFGALTLACGKDIGAECKTAWDCSQDNSRICDLSQPGGYCTMDGCDEKSCPSESVCIRFFPRRFPSASCADSAGCSADEICLPEGICVPRSSERRYCAFECGNNGDCRGGYECRQAGTEGSIALVVDPDPNNPPKFCAPAGE
jgi:hypothetical protein